MRRPDFGGFEHFSGGEAGGASRAWRGGAQRGGAQAARAAKAAQAPLANSSAWTLLQKSGEPLLLASPDGIISFANYAAHRVLGYDPNTLDGLQWLSWVHPAQQDTLSALLDKLRRQPESHDICEVQLRDRYGNWRWFEISLTNLLIDSLGWSVQLRETSSRREAEKLQSRFETQFAEAQRLASLGTWEWDVQSNRLLWSEELYHIVGIQPSETILSLEAWVSRMHPDDQERVARATERAVRERRLLDVHFRIVRPSGAVRTLHSRARIVADESGHVMRLSGIAQDVTETLQADLEVRESEERLRRLADSNIIGIVSWDAAGHITEANDAFLRLVGYTRADLWEGRLHWNELTPAEFHDADARALQQLADRGVCLPYEKEYVRKDGTRVPILMGAAYLEPGSGRDLGICFVLDMSDRRSGLNSLRESEQLYCSLVETLPQAVLVQHKGIILFANAATAQLMGTSGVQELVGRRLLDFIHPHSQMALHGYMERRNAPEAAPPAISLLRANGEVREVEMLMTPALFAAQPAMQVIVRDVTARARAINDLQRNEEHFRTLVENVSDAVSILDRNGVALYHSPTVERITGCDVAKLIGTSWLELVHPDDQPRVMHLWDEVHQAPGRTCTLEYRLRQPDGAWRVVESSGKLLPPSAPQQGMVVVTRDTTWRSDENRWREARRAVPVYETFSPIYLRLDTQGMVLSCHATGAGRSLLPEQVFGRHVRDIFPTPANGAIAMAIAEVARSRRAVCLEYAIPLEGRTCDFEVRLQPLLDGQIIAMVRNVGGEPAAPLEVMLLSEVLKPAIERAAAAAQIPNIKLVERDHYPLEVLARRDELATALDLLLNAALTCAQSGGTVNIGCEPRLVENHDNSPGLQGRVRVRISGQGRTQTAALATALAQAQATLATIDGHVIVENTTDDFVFCLDLAAARVV